MHPRKFGFVTILSVIALSVSGTILLADLTTIDVSPDPVVLWNEDEYKAVHDTKAVHPIDKYKWEYRIANQTPPADWIDAHNTLETWTTYEPRSGSYDLRLTCKYGETNDPVNPTRPDSVVIKTFTVPPPDTIMLDAPFNNGVYSVDFDISTFKDFRFKVTAAGKLLGPFSNGYAQERITRLYLPLNNPNRDTGWFTPSIEHFGYDSGYIVDFKGVLPEPGQWATINNGDEVDRLVQYVRIVYYTNISDNPLAKESPGFLVKFFKVDNNTVRVTVDAP